MTEFWEKALLKFRFAFQPIFAAKSGELFAVEALLRGTREAGFPTIAQVFDLAFEQKSLFHLDLRLREKAIAQFCELPQAKNCRLFYNLDNRMCLMPDFYIGASVSLLHHFGLSREKLVFEISERHEWKLFSQELLDHYRKQHFELALDDFGSGFSGLKTLYDSHPDYLKIDGFFVKKIDKDRRKQIYFEEILSLASRLGIHVVAEGIETPEELEWCRDSGVDFLQGFALGKPSEFWPDIPLCLPKSHPELIFS